MSNMEKKHRTWICSVLFMDIVGYTKLDVEQQMAVRRDYYALVENILNSYCPDDFITLDAGDGMAVCYTADPEDVLIMAVNLRDAFINHQDDDVPQYKVRLGINLGPVKIVELQGEKRVIGDAINVANRVMSFAGDNQLLVSRSYYDVVSTVSKDYANIFKYFGVHEDKHVRKHTVYEVAGEPGISPEPDDHVENAAPPIQAPEPVAFDDALLAKLQEQLAPHIGPVARILVKRSAGKANSLNELTEMLAGELDDDEQRANFLAACKNLV